MRWQKRGVIWRPDGRLWWARSHASGPTPVLLSDDRLRLYFQGRDSEGTGRIGFVDVRPDDPRHILRVSETPCLEVGAPGAFDSNGVFQTSFLTLPDGRLLMYYVGFEQCTTIRYRLLAGAAISDNGGDTFVRVRTTPILERSDAEQFFRCAPFVLQEQGRYRMWYTAGSAWTEVNGKTLPCYDLRYMESNDPLQWPASGQVILPLDNEDEHGIGRPWVIRGADRYQLYFSVRKRSLGQYRLGFASSVDGSTWIRNDAALGLDVSPNDWDGDAICYSAVFSYRGRTWLFYNGNNFGEAGMGVAELESA